MTTVSKFETVNAAALPVVTVTALRNMKDSGVYAIPVENGAKLEEGIERLNSRAARMAKKAGIIGFAPIGFDIVCSAVNKFEVNCGAFKRTIEIPYFGIKLTGPTPVILGWEFIATLQHEGAGTIVAKVPTADVPEGFLKQYRDAAPVCDHCHKLRNRNNTYVLRNVETQEVKQVGSNCLGEFLGGATPDSVASMAEMLVEACEVAGDADDEGGFGGRVPSTTSTIDFLQFVVCSIRQSGWLSRSAAQATDSQPTSDDAWGYGVFPGPFTPESARLHPTAEDCARAKADLEWAINYFNSTPADKLSDYEHNLKVAVLSGWVDFRKAGLVASVIVFAERAMQKEIEMRQRAERPASNEYCGEVGKRSEFELTLVTVKEWESMYGVTTFHKFVDAAGNTFIWKASGSSGLEVGTTYKLAGSVKAHEEYKGTKQTVLTRCKVK